jgi:phosphodiesterase/alkaline phosphatase D-like protein
VTPRTRQEIESLPPSLRALYLTGRAGLVTEADATFGPEVRFLGIPPGMKPNRPPSEDLQFFGLLDVDGASGRLRVELRNRRGAPLHALELEPERG